MLELFAERGGDPGRAGKRQALDPLLWRVAREGEPRWPGGELGEGRPGWHIECTVIAQQYLPKPFTVQGGGSDLIFPHHEMGAGHAYSLAGVPLARHYAHAGMVGLDGEKMSKSKGNLVLVSRLRAEGEEPAAIRLAILAHHYRTDWSWTAAGFDEAKDRLRTWRQALAVAPQGSAAVPHRRASDRARQRSQRARRLGRRRRLGQGRPGHPGDGISHGRRPRQRRRERVARRRTLNTGTVSGAPADQDDAASMIFWSPSFTALTTAS